MNKWVRRLRHACRLKTSDKEGYSNGGVDENSHPGGAEEHNNSDQDLERFESDENESSPTLSSSGPYIPISECFSGKPIIFNDAGEMETGYYNTTSFPFPPKVNWATHPTKKETNKTTVTTTTNPKMGPPAPPRPPKKQSVSSASGKIIPGTGAKTHRKDSKSNESSKQPTPVPSAGLTAPRTVFRYDNFEEVQDSSSNCSSLQSPPGSAGALYTNRSDLNTSELKESLTGPIYQNPPKLLSPNSQFSQMNPLPSPGDLAGNTTTTTGTPAPSVNRSLKPDLKKDGEFSPTQRTGAHQHSSGSMTLPSPRNNLNFSSHRSNKQSTTAAIPAIVVGPSIDRTQKPPESPLTLGPTPAQVKSQASHGSSNLPRYFGMKSNTSTLPSSPRRRAGPLVSPHDKNKPVLFHEYEQPPDLMGTYLQIDTKLIAKLEGGVEGKGHHSASGGKTGHHKKSPTFPPAAEGGSVEYRMIDHVMTKALNQTRQEREELLTNRSNPVPVSKNLN